MQELFIGLMSGTSMDAVDAVIVDFEQDTPQLISAHSKTVPAKLRGELIDICTPGADEINRMGALDVQVAELFADTVGELLRAAKLEKHKITAIGSHGQNIRHQPNAEWPFTLQIGDPNIIAAQTGITTIADFRRRDTALGGQGAPLAPAFHQHIFRSGQKPRIILNLGGIANITYLPADSAQAVSGFDTGPANILLDGWSRLHLETDFDAGGRWAASGAVKEELLKLLLSDPYFAKSPPKSTGREHFNLDWLQLCINNLGTALPPADVQATLCELTTKSIAQEINALVPSGCEIFICGGGLKNDYLISRLKFHCSTCTIQATDALGAPAQWLEAMLMAWLAWRTFNKSTGNLTSVTGASHAAILGGMYFA